MTRILAFDPGTRVCGYGVIDVGPDGSEVYVDCGVLVLAGTLASRLAALRRDAEGIVAEFQPEFGGLEHAHFGRNHQSALRLAEARGVLLGVFAAAGVQWRQVQPSTLKKHVAGHGRASKVEVRAAVMEALGLSRRPPLDATDALGVALCLARTM